MLRAPSLLVGTWPDVRRDPRFSWVDDPRATASPAWDGTTYYVRWGKIFVVDAAGSIVPVDMDEDVQCAEAWNDLNTRPAIDGHYELLGPGVEGNRHGFRLNLFIRHGVPTVVAKDRSPEGLRRLMEVLPYGGLVFDHWERSWRCWVTRGELGLPWPIPEEAE